MLTRVAANARRCATRRLAGPAHARPSAFGLHLRVGLTPQSTARHSV